MTRNRTRITARGSALACLWIGAAMIAGSGCARDRAAQGGTPATESQQQKADNVERPTRQDIPPPQQPGRIRPQ